jgi:hypothetical protein
MGASIDDRAQNLLPHRHRMRFLGIGLIAYGALGMAIIGLALVLGGPAIARADRLASSATRTLNAATDAADAAADAFVGFDASLVRAQASTADAADLSREASATLNQMAAAMSLSIFGAQPLLPLADDMRTSSDQLSRLGGDLDEVGAALGTNRGDIDLVGRRARVLADELELLNGRLAGQAEAGTFPLTALFYGFLAWQLLPALASAAAGVWLLRGRRIIVA